MDLECWILCYFSLLLNVCLRTDKRNSSVYDAYDVLTRKRNKI